MYPGANTTCCAEQLMGLIWKRTLLQSAWYAHLTFSYDSIYNREIVILYIHIFICHDHFNIYYDAFISHIDYRRGEKKIYCFSFFSLHSFLFLIGYTIRFVIPPIVTILIIHFFLSFFRRCCWVVEKERREVLIRTLINLFCSDPKCW